jgi:hypothetical protein
MGAFSEFLEYRRGSQVQEHARLKNQKMVKRRRRTRQEQQKV